MPVTWKDCPPDPPGSASRNPLRDPTALVKICETTIQERRTEDDTGPGRWGLWLVSRHFGERSAWCVSCVWPSRCSQWDSSTKARPSTPASKALDDALLSSAGEAVVQPGSQASEKMPRVLRISKLRLAKLSAPARAPTNQSAACDSRPGRASRLATGAGLSTNYDHAVINCKQSYCLGSTTPAASVVPPRRPCI